MGLPARDRGSASPSPTRGWTASPTALPEAALQAAYWLVLKNIRRMIGLDRCRWLFTGAAPISPELIRWYLALGLDMREVYGQTENCGRGDGDAGERIKLGTVGKSAPYGEVDLAPARS
jgi:long-chain acyl-CoA synthetase